MTSNIISIIIARRNGDQENAFGFNRILIAISLVTPHTDMNFQ